MTFTSIVTTLALMQFIFFGALVAKARRRLDIPAPAMTGSPEFECLVRVHANTLERLVLFMPLLWMSAQFWNSVVMAGIGSVFLLARVLYWRGYVMHPEKRKAGNILTMLTLGVLLVATLAGALMR